MGGWVDLREIVDADGKNNIYAPEVNRRAV
jgi:hypothetical protein